MKFKVWITLVVAGLAVGAAWLLSVAGAAAARPLPSPVTRNAPVTRGSGYVALGDSVTFGYQEPTVQPPPDYRRPSQFVAYPEQLGAALHLKVTNLACPGETSTSLITGTDSLACENYYRKMFPLHVEYDGPQLSYAVSFLRRHPGVRLVSLAIGPNDAFRCQAVTKDDCRSPAEQRALFNTLRQNITRILSTIRVQAHYAGQLAIVNYYSLNYSQPSINARSQKLNRTVDAAAKPFGVEVADGYSAFKTASFRFASQPCLAGLLTQLDSQPGNCGIHPSYAGQALLAQALLTGIHVSDPVSAAAVIAPTRRSGLG